TINKTISNDALFAIYQDLHGDQRHKANRTDFDKKADGLRNVLIQAPLAQRLAALNKHVRDKLANGPSAVVDDDDNRTLVEADIKATETLDADTLENTVGLAGLGSKQFSYAMEEIQNELREIDQIITKTAQNLGNKHPIGKITIAPAVPGEANK